MHGCFWHHHDGCALFRLPGTRPEFWESKLSGNRQRDIESIRALRAAGWRVAVVWECALRCDTNAAGVKLADWVRKGTEGIEILRLGASVVLRDAPIDN